MADEKELYREKYTQIMDECTPDELVQGTVMPSEIQVTAEGEHKRGTLMMSSGNNEFVPATMAGISSAVEVCILARDVEVGPDSQVYTAGYFAGTFKGSAVILTEEDEDSDHEADIAGIKTALRRKLITIV